MPQFTGISILSIGAGPIVIGQACELNYAGSRTFTRPTG